MALGHIDSGDNFTKLVNAGYDAVKAVFPDASVIVHETAETKAGSTTDSSESSRKKADDTT